MKKLDLILMKYRGDFDKKSFSREEASKIAQSIKLDFNKEKFNLDEFFKGINVELEHGTRFPRANVTNNDPILTGKIALAHLLEFPDYYTRLEKLEKEADKYWSSKR